MERSGGVILSWLKSINLCIGIFLKTEDEKINTMKYILPLVDAQGQTVHTEAYGIDHIT